MVHTAGVLKVTADETGTFSTPLELETLSPAPQTGDSLTFDAVWIGPTRERLKAGAATKIQYNKYVVSVSTSISDANPIPLQEFSIMLEVEPKTGLTAAASITVRTPSDATLYDTTPFEIQESAA